MSINKYMIKNFCTMIVVLYFILLISFLALFVEDQVAKARNELKVMNMNKTRLITDYINHFNYYNGQVINSLNYDPRILTSVTIDPYLMDSIFNGNPFYSNFLLINSFKKLDYCFSEVTIDTINFDELKTNGSYITNRLFNNENSLSIVTQYEDYYLVYIIESKEIGDFSYINDKYMDFQVYNNSETLFSDYDDDQIIHFYSEVGYSNEKGELAYTDEIEIFKTKYFITTTMSYQFLLQKLYDSLFTIIISFIIMLLLLLFIGILVNRIVKKPITQLIKEIEDLSEGDYSTILDFNNTSQFSEFARLNKEVRKIFHLMQQYYENKLEEQKRQLFQTEESNKSKTLYLANISHEMRTPLNSIIGYTQLTKKIGFTDANKVKEYFECINTSSEILLRKINDILDLAKMESNKLELSPKSVQIRAVIREMYDLLLIQAEKKGIEFSYNIDQKIPEFLEIDSTRLKQVLINLCSNAIKFTDKGYVRLEVKLYMTQNNSAVLDYKISDTGCGIPKDMLDKIFLPFVQIDNNNSFQLGSGLGLTIARDLIRLMGGDISVQSKENYGSIFSFKTYFKISKNNQEVVLGEVDNELFINKIKSLRILVAEDNIINQVFIREIFQIFKKLDIDIVNDGFEAVEICKKKQYDIILMDIQMPKLSGVEATKLIRGLKQGINVKIIALTANAFSEQISEYLSIGMNDFLSKPIDLNNFKKIILKNIIGALEI